MWKNKNLLLFLACEYSLRRVYSCLPTFFCILICGIVINQLLTISLALTMPLKGGTMLLMDLYRSSSCIDMEIYQVSPIRASLQEAKIEKYMSGELPVKKKKIYKKLDK